jgi:AhpC/TSA family
MRLIWTLSATLLLCAPAAWAADDAKDKKAEGKQAASVKEGMAALEAELRETSTSLRQKFENAQTDAEKKKIRDQFLEIRAGFAGKYLALAERFPKDPEAFEALMHAVYVGNGNKDANKAVELLASRFADHERIGGVCMQLATSDAAGVDALARAVIDKNTKKETLGLATLALAQNLKHRSAKVYDKNKEESAKLSAESEKQYEIVMSKYADVKAGDETLGAAAKGELFELRFLSIGKTAPEIEGEDLDGKKFKLSDYRGKVVMLDFWGNW